MSLSSIYRKVRWPVLPWMWPVPQCPAPTQPGCVTSAALAATTACTSAVWSGMGSASLPLVVTPAQCADVRWELWAKLHLSSCLFVRFAAYKITPSLLSCLCVCKTCCMQNCSTAVLSLSVRQSVQECTFTYFAALRLCPPTTGCSPPSVPSIVFCLMLSCSRWFPPSLLPHPATFCLVVLWIFSLSWLAPRLLLYLCVGKVSILPALPCLLVAVMR